MGKLKDLVYDERFEWILSSTDEDVDDGILIEYEQYNKFCKEANPDEYTIIDYVDYLEETINEKKKSITTLKRKMSSLINKQEKESKKCLNEYTKLSNKYLKLTSGNIFRRIWKCIRNEN